MSETKRTYVTVFHLAKILLDDLLVTKDNIDEKTIRSNIVIASNELSQSRNNAVEVDIERMLKTFIKIYVTEH